MDQELTGNAFRRFMRRRGLSRDQREDVANGSVEYINNHVQRGPSFHQRDHQPGTDRSPPIRGTPDSSRGGTNAPTEPGNIRRTQSTFENIQAQSPRRRRRDDAEEPSRKQYRCEYCNLPFGRKHHKERHVANIHRQVRSGLHLSKEQTSCQNSKRVCNCRPRYHD